MSAASPASPRGDGDAQGQVLVTGATGFLGGSLVHRLLSEGARVRVLARAPGKAAALGDLGAEVVAGDITDRAAVQSAVQGAEIIYHLAGRLLRPDVPAMEYRRTHIDGTKLILACCGTCTTLRRFVHCSTTGVLGATGERPAAEDSPIRPANIYEATKAEAEQAVRTAWRDGFPAVIARPGLVYGPGDFHLLPFFRVVLQRRFRPIGSREVWLHPIYIDDMTQGLLRCGQHESAVGECFHLAGRRPVRLADLAAAIARAGGTNVPRGHIPVLAAQAVARLGDWLPTDLRRSAPLTRSRLEFLTHSRVYDVTKARRLLGFSAVTELPAGIASTLSWYRRRGLLADVAA